MKLVPISLFLLVLILGVGAFLALQSPERRPASGDNQKYRSILVFPGGGFQTALFLGTFAGLEERGHKPDLVIGTCGGSLAAAIINTVASAERKAFLESREYYEAVRKIRVVNPSLISALGNVMGMLVRRMGLTDRLPDLFQGFVLGVPRSLPMQGFAVPFQSAGVRAVIVAARMKYGPKDVGAKRPANEKLFVETFFTDEETGKLLRETKAGVPRKQEMSRIEENALVISGVTLDQAARASISDPYYIEPISVEEHYYLTGAVNLYPIEAAKDLAEEVYMPFTSGFDTLVEQNAIHSVFGYDNNLRLDQVRGESANYWIDYSDSDELYAQAGLNPKPSLSSFAIKEGVPDTYEEYLRRTRLLWDYGRMRAMESLEQAQNSQEHVRAKILRNGS